MMSVFRFKHFSIRNELSSMKVNTDGVLLGAAAKVTRDDKFILDAGTGTGTIALMIAQRLSALGQEDCEITGIDSDEPSVREAGTNFEASPWTRNLKASLSPLEAYCPEHKFDLIVSNPPYFESDLKSPDPRRSNARHSTGSMSYKDLVCFAAAHLTPTGRMSLILPSEQETPLRRCAGGAGLNLFHILRIRTTPSKTPSRIVAEFTGAIKSVPLIEELVIQENGSYTKEYAELTGEFYL